MNFAEAAKMNAVFTRTENGAVALNTTGDARLDFFGTAGSLRGADKERVTRLFSEAFKADPLFATKIAFYARDVRGGLGERQTFRTLLQFMAKYHPEALRPNLDLIGVYGRYDDLYCLIGTPLEDDMWAAMKRQFEEDHRNLQAGNAISLLAKWIKTADASSANTRKLGILTAQKLGYSVYEFKRLVRAMRRQISIVEALMSAGRWDEIRYSAVPSRAMMIYRNAFMKHDADRYNAFVQKAVSGEETIHSATLFPYDIVEKVMGMDWRGIRITEDDALEAQWRQLPAYVEAGTNALVIADTSGSMYGRPLNSALGLAIYFAERNRGQFQNHFITFSEHPRLVKIKGNDIVDKVMYCESYNECANTNIEAVFRLILTAAKIHQVPQEEMPSRIYIVSDMEFDYCAENASLTNFQNMEQMYRKAGYKLPEVVFWNVASRHQQQPVKKNQQGVALVSGCTPRLFEMLAGGNLSPYACMMDILNRDRYKDIVA